MNWTSKQLDAGKTYSVDESYSEPLRIIQQDSEGSPCKSLDLEVTTGGNERRRKITVGGWEQKRLFSLPDCVQLDTRLINVVLPEGRTSYSVQGAGLAGSQRSSVLSSRGTWENLTGIFRWSYFRQLKAEATVMPLSQVVVLPAYLEDIKLGLKWTGGQSGKNIRFWVRYYDSYGREIIPEASGGLDDQWGQYISVTGAGARIAQEEIIVALPAGTQQVELICEGGTSTDGFRWLEPLSITSGTISALGIEQLITDLPKNPKIAVFDSAFGSLFGPDGNADHVRAANELAANGWHVIYIPSDDATLRSNELNSNIVQLRRNHIDALVSGLDNLPTEFQGRWVTSGRHDPSALALQTLARLRGWSTLYELLENKRRTYLSSGLEGYAPSVERRLLECADRVVSSSRWVRDGVRWANGLSNDRIDIFRRFYCDGAEIDKGKHRRHGGIGIVVLHRDPELLKRQVRELSLPHADIDPYWLLPGDSASFAEGVVPLERVVAIDVRSVTPSNIANFGCLVILGKIGSSILGLEPDIVDCATEAGVPLVVTHQSDYHRNALVTDSVDLGSALQTAMTVIGERSRPADKMEKVLTEGKERISSLAELIALTGRTL